MALPSTADGTISPDRGALTGALVAGIAGVAWTQWGASGLSGSASVTIRVAGVTIGLITFLWSGRLMRPDPGSALATVRTRSSERSRSMFSSPGYLIIVAVQVIAFVAGNQILARSGHAEYVVVWVAAVVGVHFVALGRLFYPGFSRLGAGMVGAGIAGAAVGLAGGGAGTIRATCGLLAAGSLFLAGGWTLAGVHATSRT